MTLPVRLALRQFLGAPERTWTNAQLCEVLEVGSGTMTPVLRRLVVAGWLERLPDEGRLAPHRLTDAGRIAARAAMRHPMEQPT